MTKLQSNQNIMYCTSCGTKFTIHVTSANISLCPECGGVSFTSQVPLRRDS